MSNASMVGAVTLDGIPLDVQDPEHYLRVLGPVVQHHHAEILSHVEDLDRLCQSLPVGADPPDRDAAAAAIGWSGGLVVALIDREWSASNHNEFEILAGYLTSRGLIGAASSVLVYGAGTCRLGDYLNSLDTRRTVVCTDLSWLVLYYGRALNERKLDRLPSASRAERTYYAVRTDGGLRLEAQRGPHSFRPPLCGDSSRIRYVVSNAFARYTGSTCDLVVLPYVLDCQRGPGMRTMLIRILQHLEVGQDVLLIMSCAKSSHSSGGRDPKVVVDTLEASGFAVTYLDITDFPYSFSMYGYGQAQTRPTTLVLRATSLAKSDAAQIFLSAKLDGESPAPSLRREGKHTIDKVAVTDLERLVLEACQTRVSYAHAFARCAKAMDETAFDSAIGNLSSQHLIDMDMVCNRSGSLVYPPAE